MVYEQNWDPMWKFYQKKFEQFHDKDTTEVTSLKLERPNITPCYITTIKLFHSSIVMLFWFQIFIYVEIGKNIKLNLSKTMLGKGYN